MKNKIETLVGKLESNKVSEKTYTYLKVVRHGLQLKMKVCRVGLDMHRV